MFYVHIDNYVNDSWGKSFCKVLDEKEKGYKKIDLINFNSFSSLSSSDSKLLARLGHLPEEKKQIKGKIDKIYSSWEHIFPPRRAYELYDNKWKEYKFLNQNNLPTLLTGKVNNKEQFFSFLTNNNFNLPVVTKKSEGAGSNQVWIVNNLSDLKKDKFPLLVQPYIDVEFDLRVIYLNEKLFAFRRNHHEGENFPYGGKWYEGDGENIDVLDYLDEDFLIKIVNTLKKKTDSPTMSFDIIFKEGEPKILEFSYCFAKTQMLECNSFYNLPEFNRTVYYDGNSYEKLDYLKHAVGYEVLNWMENL